MRKRYSCHVTPKCAGLSIKRVLRLEANVLQRTRIDQNAVLNERLAGEGVTLTAHRDLEVALVRIQNDPDDIFDCLGLHDGKRHPMN
jgi:hypothetical protein